MYKILDISTAEHSNSNELERWVYISCEDYDTPDEFAVLVKEYRSQLSGKVKAISDDARYVIDNDPLKLVFQWDSCFGITVVVPIKKTDITIAEKTLQDLCDKLNDPNYSLKTADTDLYHREKDNYLLLLNVLHDFFIRIGDKFHAKWVAEDISLWKTQKKVEHHLTAFTGGMGSVFNDFYICVQNKHKVTPEQEVWANRIFQSLTSLTHFFANKLSKGHMPNLDEVKKDSWNMTFEGIGCLDCGFSSMQRNGIDYHIASNIVENEIVIALKQGHLQKTINEIMARSLPIIKAERERIIAKLDKSGINYTEDSNFMRPCKNCGSNNTVVYRWEEKKDIYVPAKDNLKLNGNKTMSRIKMGILNFFKRK